jgi:hypothetical protein
VRETLESEFTMKDRLTQGFIAGIVGWLPQIIFTATMFKLHFTKLCYLDFAAVLTFNYLLQRFFKIVFAEFVVVGFLGTLGIGFSMLLKVIASEKPLNRSLILAAAILDN